MFICFKEIALVYILDYILLSKNALLYSARCGHCKRLKPEFEKAASILKTNDPPVILAKVSEDTAT